jgi:DNA-binding SARP family transcriptional activator
MPGLQVYLLGSFQACRDGLPIEERAWGQPRAPRLLQLALLRRPAPVPVGEAVQLLGGGMTPAGIADLVERAERVLRPEARLTLDPDGFIRFEKTRSFWVDVDAMLSHYEAGLRSAARGEIFQAIMAFQEAESLYQGDLLEEADEGWVASERDRLRAIYAAILDRLAEGCAVLARYGDAVGFCRKALSLDPLREETYQRMMVYHYYLGDLEGVREAFEACRGVLGAAGRSISAETEALWQQLSRRAPDSTGSVVAAGRAGTW